MDNSRLWRLSNFSFSHKLIMSVTISNLNDERRVCNVIYQKVVYSSFSFFFFKPDADNHVEI